jgi:hypothetical protein
MKREDQDEMRAQLALAVLGELVIAAKKRIGVLKWRGMGGPEAEDFLEALVTGRSHHLLEKWKEQRAINRSRPPAGSLDQTARYTVVVMVEALRRAGLGKGTARKRAAEALAPVFPEATSDAIKYWQTTFPPVPHDELRIAGVLKRHGHDHRQIIGWFVGLIRFTVNPAAARTAQYIRIPR